MAITELKPYLSNIAEKIKEKTFYPNLFDKDNLVIANKQNVEDLTVTETGISYNVTNSAGSRSYVLFDIGPASDFLGKTLFFSFVPQNTTTEALAPSVSYTPAIAYFKESSPGSGYTNNAFRRGYNYYLYTVSEAIADYRLGIRFMLSNNPNERVEFNDIMLAEVNFPVPYVPYGATPETINAQDYADKMTEMYNLGYDIGKQMLYDEFWDAYQMYGFRGSYYNAFSEVGWNEETYNPKYDMTVTNAYCMFYNSDCADIYKDGKISIDFSKSTNMGYVFYSCYDIKRLGVIDCSNVTDLKQTFYNTLAVKTIEKLVLKAAGNQTFTSTFYGTNKLEDLTIEGTIGRTISFSNSPLTVESAKSVINALKDYKGTSSENSYTVTFSSTTLSLLEAEGATSPNGNTWIEYAVDKGWNI